MKEQRRMEWKIKRIIKGITASEVAEAIGVTVSAITHYEKGRRDLLPQKATAYRQYIENKEVSN